MNREHPTYTLLHYGVLLFFIFTLLWAVELVAGDLPLWLGLLVALLVGISYPPLTRRLGVAPPQWARE